jgi:putative ABC transport system permease protein
VFNRTPLAWKNLVSDWRRFVLSTAGVAFAAILMFTENGFRNALLDSPVMWLDLVDADLIAISRTRTSLQSEQPFPQDLLRRAAGDIDVTVTTPIYIERSQARVRVENFPSRPIRVIGVEMEPRWLTTRKLREAVALLRPPATAALDTQTRPSFGFLLDDPTRLHQQPVELAGKSLSIVETVSIGADFANEGTLLMSAQNFADYFSGRNFGHPLDVVDLGLIQLRAGADPEQVAKRLTDLAPNVWSVQTRSQLIQQETNYWSDQTPVGIIFSIGAMMGFVVGVIICYQILFTSINDSMPEFATLKAMGYSNRYFVLLVIKQSVYLSLCGFALALVVSFGLFQVLEGLAGLPMLITIPRAVFVLVLTMTMCLASALLALRKLLGADPASLF